MYFYLYEIKNNITGKIYIGAHQTMNLDDGYMGSGKVLKLAIKKYGIENFTKTILCLFADKETMYEAENIIVNKDFVENEMTYNLKLGGEGGSSTIGKVLSEEHKQKISKSLIEKYASGDLNVLKETSRMRLIEDNPMHNEETKIKVANSLKKYNKTEEHKKNISKGVTNNSNKGKKYNKPDKARKRQPLSEETKRKISEKRKMQLA